MLTNHFCKCDTCGHSRPFNNRPFAEILKVIRAAGWRVTKAGTVWHHYCAECVAKWKAPAPVERRPLPEMWWQRD